MNRTVQTVSFKSAIPALALGAVLMLLGPAAALAQEIVLTLGPRYPGSVVLLDKPRQDGEQLVSIEPSTSTNKPMPVSWPGDRPTIPGAGDKVLKIEVLSAALQGNGSINPSLALHLEARAMLLRGDAVDGGRAGAGVEVRHAGLVLLVTPVLRCPPEPGRAAPWRATVAVTRASRTCCREGSPLPPCAARFPSLRFPIPRNCPGSP